MNIIAKELQSMEGKIGRPDKFTPERREAILKNISERIPYELAAEANGICEETLYDWLRHGRRDLKEGKDTEYARFSESIKRIELNSMRHHLKEIEDKPERWQADAWILERRWWKHFSPNAAIVEFNKRLDRMSELDNHGVDHAEIENSEQKKITE